MCLKITATCSWCTAGALWCSLSSVQLPVLDQSCFYPGCLHTCLILLDHNMSAELINTMLQQMVKCWLFTMEGINTQPPDNRSWWQLPLRETTGSVLTFWSLILNDFPLNRTTVLFYSYVPYVGLYLAVLILNEGHILTWCELTPRSQWLFSWSASYSFFFLLILKKIILVNVCRSDIILSLVSVL